MQSGRVVILGMLLLGVAAAATGLWVHYRQGRRSLEYWGVESALFIRDADKVELLELTATKDPSQAEHVQLGKSAWTIAACQDVTHAPGILHVRQLLLDDNSIDWEGPVPSCIHEHLHGLRFVQGDRQLTVVFDLECQVVRLPQSRPLSMVPVAAFLKRWIGEQTRL